MAKLDRDDKAKVKFRVIEFELEGGNATVQESMRNLAAAITRGTRPALPVLGAKPANGANGPAATLPDVTEDEQQQDLFPEDEIDAKDDTAAAARARGPRTYRSPQIIDIELSSGPVPLKTFCDDKAPDSDLKKYLVITAWLKEQRQVEAVGVDHIHTCYRHMGWFTPKDALQPMRDLKRRGWFNKADGRGEYAINHVGVNEVMKMGNAAK